MLTPGNKYKSQQINLFANEAAQITIYPVITEVAQTDVSIKKSLFFWHLMIIAFLCNISNV